MLLGLIEAVVISLILLVMSTQVIIPIWHGTITFPIFRSKTKGLVRKRAEIYDDISAEAVEEEIDELSELVKSRRKKKESE